MKTYITIIVLVLLAIGGGVYYLSQRGTVAPAPVVPDTPSSDATGTEPVEFPQGVERATTTETANDTETVIGTSVEGREIVAYHFGIGEQEVLIVGGIHGGYEWNTSLLSYELMEHFTTVGDSVPDALRVTVIPALNPDGLYEVTGKEGAFSQSDVSSDEATVVAGRFNANDVDLNRNFDCDWQSEGVWQTRAVSGGSAPFSELESSAVKAYIEQHNPAAVVVYYSAAGGVFASNCHNGVLEETTTLTNVYADASGYPAYEEFNYYEITGDMVNWLAKEEIPAISVLLTTHDDTEFQKNVTGLQALLDHVAQ